jgi:hypothetical protein
MQRALEESWFWRLSFFNGWEFVVLFLVGILLALFFHRVLRISGGKSLVLGLAFAFAFAFVNWAGMGRLRGHFLRPGILPVGYHDPPSIGFFGLPGHWHPDVQIVFAGSALALGALFLLRLYRRWTSDQLTEAERSPDGRGMRAWLSAGDVLSAVLIALLGWIGFGVSFWTLLTFLLLAIIAYPVLNIVRQPGPRPVPREDISPERGRVLRMLEEGKITAEESAELLNALGQTVQRAAEPPATSARGSRLLFLGMALVVVGFFLLPWFVTDQPGRHAPTAMTWSDGGSLLNRYSMFTGNWSRHIHAGDVPYGLGWLVLLLAIGAAALPRLTVFDRQTQRTLMLLALGMGALVLLYLITRNLGYVSIGLLLALVGYVVEFLGFVEERRTVAATEQAGAA